MSSNRTKVAGDQIVTAPEVYSKLIDLSAATTQIVCAGPALLRGVNVVVDNTQQVALANVAQEKDYVPPDMEAGQNIPFYDVFYDTNITLTVAGGATGLLSFKFIPL